MQLYYFLIAVSVWLVAMVLYSYRDYRNQWIARAHGERAPPGLLAWVRHQFSMAYARKATQRGEVNISGILMMGIGMVFLAVGFIMFPISTTATDSILAWTYTASGNASITDATFTGYTAVVGITPLLILLGYVSAAVITGFLGFKVMRGGGSVSTNPGSLMMLGLAIVFIAIGLIIEPVMLDGIASVVHGGGKGISASYTGLSAIILVVPMLIHIAFLAAAVFSGFFGIKSLANANASDD
jgi:hypothetical protein